MNEDWEFPDLFSFLRIDKIEELTKIRIISIILARKVTMNANHR